MEEQESSLIKVTLVGDPIGKTYLLNAYVYDKLPDYSFSLFEHYKKTIKVDNQQYQLELHDTPGQEDYEKLRPLTYPHTKCFIVCFSVSERPSYANVSHVWLPELKRHMPDVPIVLVATKVDLRGDSKLETITSAEGRKLQRQIKAGSYVECSATKRTNLHEVFEEAVRCSIRKKAIKKSKYCTLF